jgi:hypothetical protein
MAVRPPLPVLATLLLEVGVLLLRVGSCHASEAETPPPLTAESFTVTINTFKPQFTVGEPITVLVAWGADAQRALVFEDWGSPGPVYVRHANGAPVRPPSNRPTRPIHLMTIPGGAPMPVDVEGERVEVVPVYELPPGAGRTRIMHVPDDLQPLVPGKYTLWTSWGVRVHLPTAVMRLPSFADKPLAPYKRETCSFTVRSNAVEIEVIGEGE